MKVSFAVAMLLSSTQAVRVKDSPVPKPWDPKTLPECPSDPARTIMDDGRTHVTKYPYVGASCKPQTESKSFVQIDEESYNSGHQKMPMRKAEREALKNQKKEKKEEKEDKEEKVEESKDAQKEEKQAKPLKKSERDALKNEEAKDGDKKEEKKDDAKEGEAKPEKEAKKEEKRLPNTPRKMITSETDPAAADYRKKLSGLQHCPDFNERFSL